MKLYVFLYKQNQGSNHLSHSFSKKKKSLIVVIIFFFFFFFLEKPYNYSPNWYLNSTIIMIDKNQVIKLNNVTPKLYIYI